MDREEEAASALEERIEGHALQILLAVTALALAVRLHRLGARVAHFDEGRVGYDVLRYGATGLWEYRPIVHGPFLPRVNDLVFSAIGPSDFSMRLVVAVVGGLLPLAPWLFRRYFRNVELIAIGGFLAFDAILLYYSRFMRNDVLVAAFMLFALGCFVRFADTRRARYLYGGVPLTTLGFTTKANAAIYVACWLGAGTLVVADRLRLRARDAPTRRAYVFGPPARAIRRLTTGRREALAGAVSSARRYVGARRRTILVYGGHLLVALSVAAVVLVYFYAPRTAGTGVGFERLAANPDLFPSVAETALGDFWNGLTEWAEKSGEERDYDSLYDRFEDYVTGFFEALATYSPALVFLAVGAFARERVLASRPRQAVCFFGYWGLVSVPGYAVGMDIWAAWALVHALVPLAFPAGVAVAWVAARGVEAIVELRAGQASGAPDSVLSVSVVALLCISTLLIGAGTAFDPTNTRGSGEDHLVQYAQPSQEVGETLEDLSDVVEATGDPVVFYGESYAVDNESAAYRPPVDNRWETDEDGVNRLVDDNGGWYDRLPLPWYLERADADLASARDGAELDRLVLERTPVAIITEREVDGEDNEAVVDERAGDYVTITHDMRSPGRETVFYLRADALEALDGGS